MKNGVQDDGLFCDWLSVWQVHPAHAPLNSGCIVTYDGGGTPVFERHRSARLQGSHSTSCSVKSDGSCVVLSGNFGRLNRTDNLFNFDPLQTLERANVAAKFAGLPAFQFYNHRNNVAASVLELPPIGYSGRDFQQERTRYEFIHLSRIDLTKNYRCGSVAAARSVIRAVSGKSVTRVKKGVGGDASVWWSNTRYMLKVYIKSLEMEAHGVNSGAAYEYARDNGIIRLELELKRRELSDLGWSDFAEFLKAWDMGKIHSLFRDYEKILTVEKMSNDADFIDALPQKLRVTAAAFLSGRDVRSMMKKTCFYKYRKALLDYGIDIADERPAQLNIKIRTVEITPVVAPEWYWKVAA